MGSEDHATSNQSKIPRRLDGAKNEAGIGRSWSMSSSGDGYVGHGHQSPGRSRGLLSNNNTIIAGARPKTHFDLS